MSKHTFIATCAFGLESEVSFELKELGYDEQETRSGRVLFKGDFSAAARANLWLRTAERVLWRIGEFEARSFEALYDNVRGLPWGDILPETAEFPVDGNSVSSQLSSVPAIQRITKKAVVDAMAARYRMSQLPETGIRHRIRASILKDIVTVTLDMSGSGLHKRGYRSLQYAAPLKETLAAAVIRFSRWRKDRPLADPFCGSGTLAIEAAMIGRSLAPGAKRTFAAELWPVFPSSVWKEAREEAKERARPGERLEISASDISPRALELVQYHARAAGVADTISIYLKDVRDFSMAQRFGVLVANPPYGDRMGQCEEVDDISSVLGGIIRRHPSWSFFIISGYERFERSCGVKVSKRRKLYNGRIRCTLHQYFGQRPQRKVDVASILNKQGFIDRIISRTSSLPKSKLKRLELPAEVKKALFAVHGSGIDKAAEYTTRERLVEAINTTAPDQLQALADLLSPGDKVAGETEQQTQARLERWRDGIVAGDRAFFAEVKKLYPKIDLERLEKLALQSRKETESLAPPRASRKIFRYLRSFEKNRN